MAMAQLSSSESTSTWTISVWPFTVPTDARLPLKPLFLRAKMPHGAFAVLQL